MTYSNEELYEWQVSSEEIKDADNILLNTYNCRNKITAVQFE